MIAPERSPVNMLEELMHYGLERYALSTHRGLQRPEGLKPPEVIIGRGINATHSS